MALLLVMAEPVLSGSQSAPLASAVRACHSPSLLDGTGPAWACPHLGVAPGGCGNRQGPGTRTLPCPGPAPWAGVWRSPRTRDFCLSERHCAGRGVFCVRCVAEAQGATEALTCAASQGSTEEAGTSGASTKTIEDHADRTGAVPTQTMGVTGVAWRTLPAFHCPSRLDPTRPLLCLKDPAPI